MNATVATVVPAFAEPPVAEVRARAAVAPAEGR